MTYLNHKTTCNSYAVLNTAVKVMRETWRTKRPLQGTTYNKHSSTVEYHSSTTEFPVTASSHPAGSAAKAGRPGETVPATKRGHR